MGPLGGEGFVSFRTVAVPVIHYAPPNTRRLVIIEAIAMGIGRTAAHEFAHQILFGQNLHASTDAQSYEYESADRAEQYYGSMHRDGAWPFLAEKLGRWINASIRPRRLRPAIYLCR